MCVTNHTLFVLLYQPNPPLLILVMRICVDHEQEDYMQSDLSCLNATRYLLGTAAVPYRT